MFWLEAAEEVFFWLDVAEEDRLGFAVSEEAGSAAVDDANAGCDVSSEDAAADEEAGRTVAAEETVPEDAGGVSGDPPLIKAKTPHAVSPPATKQASASAPTRSRRRRRTGLTGVFSSREVMQ